MMLMRGKNDASPVMISSKLGNLYLSALEKHFIHLLVK